jgi:hypothetical protein
MIYIEYISRRPGIELEDFHETFLRVQCGWESGASEDQLIVNAARTWRLGPEPEYFTVWHTANTGFERIDEWQRIFDDRAAKGHVSPLKRVARMDAAGCYEALRPPLKCQGGLYYVERFAPRVHPEAVRDAFEKRADNHPRLKLALLAGRVGWLGPDPAGFAIWIVPSFGALEDIAEDLKNSGASVALDVAGVYVDVGREIL